MSTLKNIGKQLSQGLLGQSLVLISGILLVLMVIYAITWTQSGITSNNLSQPAPQCYIDTVTTEGQLEYWFIDEQRPSKIQVHPALAKQTSVHRLLQQLIRIRIVRLEHYNYFRFFYRMRYSMSIVQAVVSLLAIVIGLVITKEGWGMAKPITLVTFFVFSATAALLQLLPETMHLHYNINANTTQYTRYQSLEDEALTYLSTHLSPDEDSLGINSFIVYLDYRMSDIHEVSLELGDFPVHKIQDKLGEIDKRLKEKDHAEEE